MPSNTTKTRYPKRIVFLLRTCVMPDSEEGSALVFAIIFILVVLSTSVAISTRGLQGFVGSVFNQDSKLARDAAEIGVLRAVMLLNEPNNRKLLIKANLINSSTGNQIRTNPEFVNPCPGSGIPDLMTSSSSMGIKDLNGSTANYPTIAIDDGSASGGIQRRFKIVSIAQSGIPDLEGGTTGGIIIKVEGQAYRNGKILATSTISRELEVVEKCCGLSLGGPSQIFGGDTRPCDQGNPGLGLVAGTAYKNNGKFFTTGGSGLTFSDENDNAIPRVYCLDNSSTNDCSNGGINSGTNTKLVETEPDLKDVPPIPSFSGTGATSCDGSSSSTCEIEIDSNTILSTADFANWGADTEYVSYTSTVAYTPIVETTTQTVTTTIDQVRQCNAPRSPVAECKSREDTYTDGSITTTSTNVSLTTVGTSTSYVTTSSSTTTISSDPELLKLKSHCFQRSESGVTVTYCSLDRLEIDTNKKLIIDTTSGPIRFYFPNSSDSDDPSIELKNGNSAITQVNSSKSPLSYADLIFYGISRANLASKCGSFTTSCQHIQLGGGTADSTTFFAYFPAGYVELFGTASYNGMIWSNIIEATGSANFVTSSSGVGEVLTLLGMSSQGGGGGGNEILLGEYVTRLTKKFSFF